MEWRGGVVPSAEFCSHKADHTQLPQLLKMPHMHCAAVANCINKPFLNVSCDLNERYL